MLLFDWAAAALAGPAGAGGKGWNLGRLHRYGFLIPKGGVISSEAYRQFMGRPDIRERLTALEGLSAADVTSPEAAAALTEMRRSIEAAPLPASVADDLGAFLLRAGLHDVPVAVRSSATAEDSAAASFAGIHQSFLNVTGLPAITGAVKGCYASLWTPQAVAYRRKHGLSDDAVSAAVVVLAMVPATVAGVCFTCDPQTGRRDRFAISASPGLGEAVVSGATEPDEFLVDITRHPPHVASYKPGRKARMTVASPGGGTVLVDAPVGVAGRPALSDEQVQELAYLAGRVQDALGQLDQPQDVEWAHDGDRFWLLQARPVTSLPAPSFAPVAEQPVVWSNANLRDILPGVLSEMNWSFIRSGMDVLLSAPLRAAGYRYGGGMTWVRLFQGRAYFNLTAMQWAYYDGLAMLPSELSLALGGHQPEITLPPSTWSDRMRRQIGRLRMVRRTLQALSAAPAIFSRFWQWAEEQEAYLRDADSWAPDRLLAQSLALKATMEEYLVPFQLMNGGAGGIHSELITLLTPYFGERAPGLVNAMLAGSKGITSAEQGERLVGLGNFALQEERTRTYFTEEPFTADAWADRLEGTLFKPRFEEYLREYGHRGVYEVEPMNPRWQEDPTYLLETVRSQVLSGRPITIGGQAPMREGARREVFARLGMHPRRFQVRYYLRQAALAAAHREMGKSILVKLIGVSRYWALAVGRRMVAEGLLNTVPDVFHLTWLDLEAYLVGRPGLHGLKALVADRRLLREAHLRQEPPDIIVGEVPIKKAPPPEATGPVLQGTGVAAGHASGTARVIRHPDEGARLQPGEILVAPSTDPAWTPLFLRASAVVMEVGGYLSHGAIVAREYGLPAVANIPGLLQTIKDGEQLTVDGSAGRVYRQRSET